MHVSPVRCIEVSPASWWTGQLVIDADGYRDDRIEFYSPIATIFIKAMQCLRLDVLFDLRTITITDINEKIYQLTRKSAFLWLQIHGDSRFKSSYQSLNHVNLKSSDIDAVVRSKVSPLHARIADACNELHHRQRIKADKEARPSSNWSLAERSVETDISQINSDLAALRRQL